MRRYAMLMFDQSQFKVNVKIEDLTLYDCILSPFFIVWNPGGIYK